MIIRAIESDDISELAELAAITYAETFGHSLSDDELASVLAETRSQAYFRSVMDTDVILVASIDNRLAGYIQLSDADFDSGDVVMTPGDQIIRAIYIHSDFQGRGIGKTLMNTAFEHPRMISAEQVFIVVWDENTRALNFYLNYGFREVGQIDFEVDGEVVGHDILMVRSANSR